MAVVRAVLRHPQPADRHPGQRFWRPRCRDGRVSKGKFVDQLTWIKKMYDEGTHRTSPRTPARPPTTPSSTASARSPRPRSPTTAPSASRPSRRRALDQCHAADARSDTERTNSLRWRRFALDPQGQVGRGIQGRRGVLQLPRPARAGPDGGRPVTGYIPVTKAGFEAMKADGFYDDAPVQGPRTGHRQSLTFTPADDEHPRHPPRQLCLDPRRNGQDHAGRAVQQRSGSAGPRGRSTPRATKSCAASKPTYAGRPACPDRHLI